MNIEGCIDDVKLKPGMGKVTISRLSNMQRDRSMSKVTKNIR